MKPNLLLVISVITTILFVTNSSSCKKDKTCHGKVHVVDNAGVPVASATVLLDAAAQHGEVSYTGTTDGSGDVSFDVTLPAIFDVTASKTGFSASGTGVIRLDEAGKEDAVTITMP
jgi:hypothetical protein